MAKIQLTHITGEPMDIATFLNAWNAPIAKDPQYVQGELANFDSGTSFELGTRIEGFVSETSEEAIVAQQDKSAVLSTEEDKPKRKRTSSTKKTKEELVAEEALPLLDAQAFIEGTAEAQSAEAQSAEAQSTEAQSTEAQSTEAQSTEVQSAEITTEEDLKEKAIEEAFQQLPSTEEEIVNGTESTVEEKAESTVPEEDAQAETEVTKTETDNTKTEDESASEATTSVSFEMMKEAVKIWCVQVTQGGKGDAKSFANALFRHFGDSASGMAVDCNPEKYKTIFEMVQDPSTVETVSNLLAQEI